MGLWEDAQRQASQPTPEERQQNIAAEFLQAHSGAIREFIDGMQRLGIAPREHRFLKPWTSGSGLHTYKPTRHRLVGWNVENPLTDGRAGWDVVVTPNGDIYEMRYHHREPRRLDQYLSFGAYDTVEGIETLVKRGLEHAIRTLR